MYNNYYVIQAYKTMKKAILFFMIQFILCSAVFGFSPQRISLEIQPALDIRFKNQQADLLFGIYWEYAMPFSPFTFAGVDIEPFISGRVTKMFTAEWVYQGLLGAQFLNPRLKPVKFFNPFHIRFYGFQIKRSLISFYQVTTETAYQPEYYEFSFILNKQRFEHLIYHLGFGGRLPVNKSSDSWFSSIFMFVKII